MYKIIIIIKNIVLVSYGTVTGVMTAENSALPSQE